MRILEEFWYGNVEPTEYDTSSCKEYKKLLELICRNEEKLNKDGARVLLKGKIDFAEHHYETECTVRWNESLSETAIKNASITSVVDSQEKELAAAI